MENSALMVAQPAARKKHRLLNLFIAIITATVVGLIARDVTEPAARPLWHTVLTLAREKISSPALPAKPVAKVYSRSERALLDDVVRRTTQ